MKKMTKRANTVTSFGMAMMMAVLITSQVNAADTATVSMQGDANNDQSVTIADAISLAKYLVIQDTLSEQGAVNCDMNSDNILNGIDLTLLKRLILNPVVTPPVTPPATDDHWITAITYSEQSVALFNAMGTAIAADTAENVTITDNTYVTITQPGEYDIDGNCSQGQLNINCDKTAYAAGQVTCNLRGLTLSNSADSPIYVTAIDDEFVLTVKNGYTNTISDGTAYTNADQGVGAIYSCDDMKIKGQGTLIVNGNCEDGIVCKNDLKIWNGDIQVKAVDDGIRGKDSLRIGDPDDTDYTGLKLTVNTSSGDGLKSNGTDADTGLIRLTGGTIVLNAFGDAISAEQTFEMNGGDLTILKSTATSSATSSAKGIKAVGLYDAAGTTYQSGGTITINGGSLNIHTSDDCIHAAGDIALYGGRLTLRSDDDAVHSDHDLTIGQGESTTLDDIVIYIAACYEGFEGLNIHHNSGTAIVNSTDDAYNAAGGADGSGNNNQGGWNPGGWNPGFGNTGNYSLNLNGGFALANVTDGDHDGFDSNGSLTINGGYFISNGNEPFDSDGTKSYVGGVYIINKGSGGMGGMGGMGGGSLTSTVTASVSANANTRITLADTNGNVIVSFVANKRVSSLTAGCSNYPNAVFYTGGTINGTPIEGLNDTQICYISGTISGGTQASGNNSSAFPW